MSLLLTAFEPFGPWESNSTTEVARRAAAQLDAAPVVLPVDLTQAPLRLRAAIDELAPSAVLLLGLHGRARAVRVERAALNIADFRIADNAGRTVRSAPLVPGAPDGLMTGVDVNALVDAMRHCGVPADVSNSAGTYLCNAVYYVALLALVGGATPALFLHLPPLPGAAARAQERLVAMRASGEAPPATDARLTGEDGGLDPGVGMLLDLQVHAVVLAARHLLAGAHPSSPRLPA